MLTFLLLSAIIRNVHLSCEEILRAVRKFLTLLSVLFMLLKV